MFTRLHALYEMDGDIGSASESPSVEAEGTPSGDGIAPAPTTEEADVSKQASFAKRLNEERTRLEKEYQEKYKDYDTYKKTAEYFGEINGNIDVMTLAERIEMERLQDAADKQNVPVEVLKRLQELESKAAKADEYEQQQAKATRIQSFENGLKEFAKDKQIGDKPVDHMELWHYMHENGISKPEAAYKAMKADVLEKQLEEAEKNGMKKLIQAKASIPKVTGNKAQGQVTAPAPKTWAEARQRAMQRGSE